MKEIEIKDISGKTRFSTPINKGAKGKFTLMKEDYIILPFSASEPIPFRIGDYADLSGVLDESLGGKLAKIYEIVDLQTPSFNTSTGAYDYQLRMDVYYWKWKNKIFKYTPEHAGSEASWSLTAALDVQLGVFLRNLKALGYTYKGTDFTFSIDDTVENKAVAMTYDNINMLDALFSMAGEDKWNCDCWITDSVIHFGRNEFGDAVKIGRDVEASAVTRSESKGTYATRIYAFGSTRNIPPNYRPVDEQAVVNGVVQKRLMLPADTPYIDAYEGMSTEEAIEDIVVFDDVYPRRVGTMSDVKTVDRKVENPSEGEAGTFKAYQYKDTGLVFKDEYIIEGQELEITFQSGKLNGMRFGVHFEPEGTSEGSQIWEIVRNENYGRPLPDDVMYPINGDKYILSGFNIQLVSDQYIPEAEQELKEKAQKYADKAKKDDGTYPVTLKSTWVYEDQLAHTFEFGQRINLVDDTYFENDRISRVLGWELNLDIPWDSPVYTIGESMPYSRIGEIEDKVDSLTYKGQTYNGGGGSGVYVIRVNDSTSPSDSNVFSALRALKMFLRKDKEDETNYLLKLLGGMVSDNIESQDFSAGPFGSGFLLKRDPKTGKSYAEIDEIYVRLKAYFDTLEIKHLSHAGGRIVVSPAGMKCNRVEVVSAEYDPVYDGRGDRLYDADGKEVSAPDMDGELAYRCYFNNTDGEKTVVNEFALDDLVQCREFNVKAGVSSGASNRYYWRRVVGLGDDYIDLSADDCDPGSVAPEAGDDLVTIGNRTDKSRQHAILISSYDDDAPCIKLYSGINSYSMKGKEITVISPNTDKNVFTGKMVIRPGSTGFGNIDDAPDISGLEESISSANKDISDFKEYVDGAFSDAIVSESESKAIEKYLNTINQNTQEINSVYTVLYSNPYLSGTPKTRLLTEYNAFIKAKDELTKAVRDAISDGKTNAEEKKTVDQKYSVYSTAYARFKESVELANKSIQDAVKRQAVSESGDFSETSTRNALDEMAQKIGYDNFADMASKAESKETIIQGGKINTSLITAEAIVTSLLIARAIRSSELNVNDNFIVKTDGSVDIEGVIRSKGIRTELVLSDGYMRIMHNGSETLRMSVNESTGLPELTMTYQGKTLYATPNVLSFGIEKGKFLRIDPSVLGEGVIRKDSDNHLYIATQSYDYITVSMRVSPERSGRVSPFTGSVLRLEGSSEEVTAIASEGYRFSRWSDGGAQTHNVVWTEGSNLTAYFEKEEVIQYKLMVAAMPGGSTSPNGTLYYNAGTKVTITATPDQGYKFKGWLPEDYGTSNPIEVTMDAEKSFIATFTEVKENLGGELLPEWSDVSYWDNNPDARFDVSADGVKISSNTPDGLTPTGFVSFGVGYLQDKLKSGKKYRLTFECEPLSYTDGVNPIISTLGKLEKDTSDIDASITNESIFGGKAYGGKWNAFTLDMTMLSNSDSEHGVLFFGGGGNIKIRNISLKELL